MGVGWPGRWVGEAAVVSGFVCSAWSAAMLLLFLGRRARRVCSRLWMTAAMSAASVWAARPNARQNVSETVKKHVNENIAHYNPSKAEDLGLTYGHIHEAADTICRIYQDLHTIIDDATVVPPERRRLVTILRMGVPIHRSVGNPRQSTRHRAATPLRMATPHSLCVYDPTTDRPIWPTSAIVNHEGWTCETTGTPLGPTKTPQMPELTQGGKRKAARTWTTISNLLCGPCNTKKGTGTVADLHRRHGR